MLTRVCRCLTAAPVLLCHEAAQGWLIPSSHPARRSGSAPLAHPCTELRQEAVELVALHAPPLSIHKAGQRVLLAQRSRACSGSSREERGEPCRGHPARRERECTWKSSPSHAALGRCPIHPPTNCSHLQATNQQTRPSPHLGGTGQPGSARGPTAGRLPRRHRHRRQQQQRAAAVPSRTPCRLTSSDEPPRRPSGAHSSTFLRGSGALGP